jgi:putative salt-induced outer membrane protein
MAPGSGWSIRAHTITRFGVALCNDSISTADPPDPALAAGSQKKTNSKIHMGKIHMREPHMMCFTRDGMRFSIWRQRAMSRVAGCFLLALAFTAPVAQAEEAGAADPAADAPTGPWAGNVRLGYLASTGNSETENSNFAFGVDYTTGAWSHGVTGSAIGASTDDENTAEAYTLGVRSTYDYTERDYLFGRIDWLKDKFSSYDQQLSQTVGYGRRVILQPHQTLNLEIGAGARQSELRDGDEENEAIARLGAKYEYLFNESAQFNFDLGVQSGQENTFTEAVAALKTKLVGSLAAVVSYTVRNNTDVLDDTEKTDTLTSISLSYSF